MLVLELQREVGDAIGQPASAVAIVYDAEELRGGRTLAEEQLPSEADLCAVVCQEQVEIAEALYARVRGQIWVPAGAAVEAPFSGELVAFCESAVVRLYDEWVTRCERHLVKSGRPSAEGDPGSDSEYEEVECGTWEAREETVERWRSLTAQIYIDDGSGERALMRPRDLDAWACNNSELTYVRTEEALAHLGGGAMQRTRGWRREERCLSLGDRCEVLGEARVDEGGRLTICEPHVPSEQLHRLDSPRRARRPRAALADWERPSALRHKAFLGAVLREYSSLEKVHLAEVVCWRCWKRLFYALGATFLLRAVRFSSPALISRRLFLETSKSRRRAG